MISRNDLQALATAQGEIHLLVMEPGDIHEAKAGRRLAAAIAGAGVRAEEPRQGRVRLVAEERGLLAVDTQALRALNELEGVAVYTRFNGQPVEARQVVAEAKVVPLVVQEALIEAAEVRARQAKGGVVCVRPFRQHQIAIVVRATREGSGERFRESISRRLNWYGGTIKAIEDVSEEPQMLAALLRRYVEAGADLILIAGGSFSDPLDPAFLSLPLAGARMERNGLPVHPGSMTWLAYLKGIPIVGLASCGWFSESTAADLLLARLFTGERPRREDLADLGVGGLLGPEQEFRFPGLR
ncbi:MAG: molybdenum cofactor biosynthesis protein MoaB [Herpetosiphonaceae bacterium]|nr:MAG: molybdenum cofactor biosynthesis protein MoaB [Herpetosiphonaceae bacterium]